MMSTVERITQHVQKLPEPFLTEKAFTVGFIYQLATWSFINFSNFCSLNITR